MANRTSGVKLRPLALVFLVAASLAVATAAVVPVGAPGATERAMNCGGLCLYAYAPSTLVKNDASEWSFLGQFHERLNAPATKLWQRLSNAVDWKLQLGRRFSSKQVTAEIHSGTPRSPGRLLAVLCKRCRLGATGTFRLSDPTLALMFGRTALGDDLPVNAYVVLRTSETLRRQLRDA